MNHFLIEKCPSKSPDFEFEIWVIDVKVVFNHELHLGCHQAPFSPPHTKITRKKLIHNLGIWQSLSLIGTRADVGIDFLQVSALSHLDALGSELEYLQEGSSIFIRGGTSQKKVIRVIYVIVFL